MSIEKQGFNKGNGFGNGGKKGKDFRGFNGKGGGSFGGGGKGFHEKGGGKGKGKRMKDDSIVPIQLDRASPERMCFKICFHYPREREVRVTRKRRECVVVEKSSVQGAFLCLRQHRQRKKVMEVLCKLC